jgi:hypothetical protein
MKGVEIIYSQILKHWRVRGGKDTFTALVTVDDLDFEKVLEKGFWARFVWAREWYEDYGNKDAIWRNYIKEQ